MKIKEGASKEKRTVKKYRCPIAVSGEDAERFQQTIREWDGLGMSLPVYATGGLSQLIVPHCKHDITLNDNLVLKGLELLYIKNR